MTLEQIKAWTEDPANHELPHYLDVIAELATIENFESQKCNHFTLREMRGMINSHGLGLYAALVNGMIPWAKQQKRTIPNWNHYSDSFLQAAIDYRKYCYERFKSTGRSQVIHEIFARDGELDDLWRCSRDRELDEKILQSIQSCEELIGKKIQNDKVVGPNGHETTDPLAMIFHKAIEKPVRAICIKDNPPMTGFGKELKQGDEVMVTGLIHDPEIGNFAIRVESETAYYQYDYFREVK